MATQLTLDPAVQQYKNEVHFQELEMAPDKELDNKADEEGGAEMDANGVAKPDTESSNADSKTDSKIDSKTDSKKEDSKKENSKVDSKEDSKVDSKKDSKIDSKRDLKADSKVDSKADSKSDSNADSKTDSKADSKQTSKANAKQKSKADSKTDAKQETKPAGKSDEKSAYGERLLCTIIDDKAQSEPASLWATLLLSPDLKEQRNVTYGNFANAVNRVAWWLESVLGETSEQEILYYDGPPDVRFLFFAVASMKIGHKALFISPRNTDAARLELLEKTNCKRAFGSKTDQMEAVLSERDLEFHDFLSLDDCLDDKEEELYEFKGEYKDIANEAFLTLHTSGSTNNPKPIDVTHGLTAVIDSFHDLPEVDGRECISEQFEAGLRVFMALPPFHSAGINFFAYSVFYGFSLIFCPSNAPPSGELLDTVLDAEIADAGYMPPTILEEIAQSESTLAKLESWRYVGFGGGPLAQEAGDAIREKTRIYNCLGSTETFHLPEFSTEEHEDWSYHRFHPSLGIEFQKQHDELYEMVFKRSEENKKFQAAFWTFPDDDEYAMKDLYAKHPDKEDLWLFKGRSDDMILLSSGEKVQPNEAEALMTEELGVKSAIGVGDNRFQPAFLLEPASDDTSSLEGSLSDIVDKANKVLPGHAKIDSDHIKVLDSSYSMPRSSKGVVQRKKAISELEGEIDDIYSNEENGISDSHLNFYNEETLRESVWNCIIGFSPDLNDLGPDDDFFENGMDSLQAMRVTRTFRKDTSEAGLDDKRIKNNLLYNHPTLSTLVATLLKLSNDGEETDEEDSFADIQSTLDAFRSDLPGAKFCVILTGSSGSLGSYILDNLMRSTKVRKIFCLNRKEDAEDRQKETNEARGLSTEFEDNKVEFLQADLAKENLGLAEDIHSRLLAQATHVIHIAWPINFNHAFNYFKPQVLGCRHLVDFSAASSHHAEIIFMSSIGAGNNWGQNHSGAVPEEPIADLSAAEPMGYAQSKLVSELLFDSASSLSGVPTTVCRIGQIAGPVLNEAGQWSKQEWLPSLVASSAYLQKLPETLAGMESVDWIPVDLLAQSIVELLESRLGREPACRILNMVNPSTTTWNELLPVAQEMLPGSPQTVSLEEWVSALKKSAETDEGADYDRNPAVRLLDFYENLQTMQRPGFETTKAAQASKTLAGLSEVSHDWMRRWMEQWAFE